MSDEEFSEVEYAVQYRSYIGGKFDRTVAVNSRTGFPYTREQAEEQVAKFNKGREDITPSRVATRRATPWKPL